VLRGTNDSSGIQSLYHHLRLALLGHEKSAASKDGIHSIHDLVKAARGTALLSEAGNRKLIAPPVLNDRHKLDGEGNLLHVQDYRLTLV
jgi:hypothetical protein